MDFVHRARRLEIGSRHAYAGGLLLVLRANTLDREAKAFLGYFNLCARRPLANYSVRELRQLWRLIALALGRQAHVASIGDHTIDGPRGAIELRIFRPERVERQAPALIWCHGGGFLVGGVDTAESICRHLTRTAAAVVVAVRYRLAPEYDLYAGREDVLAIFRCHPNTVARIDGPRLAIGGDSAGGKITAAVAPECVRQGGPRLLLQVLAYPATPVGKD